MCFSVFKQQHCGKLLVDKFDRFIKRIRFHACQDRPKNLIVLKILHISALAGANQQNLSFFLNKAPFCMKMIENVWNMQVRVQKRGWTYSWIDAPCPLCIYPPAQPRHIDLHATFDFGKDCRTNEVTLLVGILGPWHIHGISMIHGEFISRLPSYSHHTPMFLNRNGIKALEWWRSITTHRSKVDMIHAMLHVHYISIGGYWRSNRNETITDGILSGWDTESAWNIKKYGIHHYNPLQVHHLGMIMDGLSIN